MSSSSIGGGLGRVVEGWRIEVVENGLVIRWSWSARVDEVVGSKFNGNQYRLDRVLKCQVGVASR
jgi:hypothetical protein